MWQELDLPRNIVHYKKFMWGFLVLVVMCAGLRFSDGTVLLAISRGLLPSEPSLKGFGQYLWDAPLKVGLLRLLPANVIAIGLTFAVLGALPALGLLSRDSRILWLTAATVFLTPTFKVSIQNLGVGDGLVMFLAFCVCASSKIYVVATAALLVALWHPHQSFFLGASYFVGRFCYFGKLERRQAVAVATALAVGAGAYVIYRLALPFSFTSRAGFVAEHGQDTLRRNLILSPVAFAPIILWVWFIAPKPSRLSWVMLIWLCVLGAVAVYTPDVTRVMTITSLPIVLAGADRILDGPYAVSGVRAMTIATLILLIPPLSWSGLDYLVWPDLISGLCKWHLYCGFAGSAG
jgi:hypothetical protein